MYRYFISEHYSGPSLLELQKLFPTLILLYLGVNQLPNKCWTHLLHWRSTHFALKMNSLVLETNVLDTRVQTSATHSQQATSDFQTDLISRYMLLTGTCTHVWKQAVSCSRTHFRITTYWSAPLQETHQSSSVWCHIGDHSLSNGEANPSHLHTEGHTSCT